MSAPHNRAAGRYVHRWSITLLLVFGAVLALGYTGRWQRGLYGMFEFQPRFADTVAVLAAGETWLAGGDIYAPLPNDPYGRPHVYGPGWLVTGALGLETADALWVGSVLTGVFALTATLVLRPRRAPELLIAAALLCSPPVLLGVTRGNNDLVVFVMLAAAAWLLARSDEGSAIVGRILVGLAAVLKMYPFAVLPALLLRRPAPAGAAPGARTTSYDRSATLLWFGVTTLGCVGTVGIWAEHYHRALALAPNPVSIVAYGLPVSIVTWQAMHEFRPAFLVGGFAAFVIVGIGLGKRWRALYTLIPSTGFGAMAFLFGAMAWLFSFIVIRSFPYRLVLLLLPARLWLQRSRESGYQIVARTQLLLWAIIAWLDIPKRAVVGHPEQTAGFSPRMWKAVAVMIGFEQLLALLLTVCLTISIVGAFVRHWPRHTAPVRASKV